MQNIIESYFDRLWPICRSITGNGLRESFEILKEIIPLELEEIPSGTEVLDWIIPNEWNIDEAYLIDPNGNKVIDFKENNLHIVNYSIPVDKEISWEDLQEHLHYKKELPDAIPYVTSYYKEKWGFSLSYNQYETLLKEGNYRAVIKTTLSKGSLTYGSLLLKGKSDKEIVFTSYLCHPSMANNELSGPLTLAFIYRELSQKKGLEYSYRFILAPETIGALAYLAKYGDELKAKVRAGYVLTCCGDKVPIGFKKTREDQSFCNVNTIDFFQKNVTGFKLHNFDPIGSDERQYCSPGYNLPMGSIVRSKYHEFKEYHTSLDNKSFISFASIEENVHLCIQLIEELEATEIYERTDPYGEPNLGKRNLYEDLANKQNMSEWLVLRMRLLNFLDGKLDIKWFKQKYGYSDDVVNEEVEKLLAADLIKRVR